MSQSWSNAELASLICLFYNDNQTLLTEDCFKTLIVLIHFADFIL